jgi:hypothetical protein
MVCEIVRRNPTMAIVQRAQREETVVLHGIAWQTYSNLRDWAREQTK